MPAGSGNRSPAGKKNWPACKRSMITTAVIAPKPANSTALTIPTTVIATRSPRGTPTVAMIGVATAHTNVSATDKKASSHMTARKVRSYRRPAVTSVLVMSSDNQRR